jgi:uncharacterized protein YutE (UPF0331/DUF86 family)
MYDINTVEIEARLAFIQDWKQAYEEVCRADYWQESSLVPVVTFAQERLLQLAIEMVTDVASYLIDGYIMRDAGSYEDIIEIMRDEQVVSEPLANQLVELVSLKKDLQQHYLQFPRGVIHPQMAGLATMLEAFKVAVHAFLAKPI